MAAASAAARLKVGGRPQLAAQQTARVALGRLGEADDVVSIIAFLASAEGRWVTGQVIDASGGTAL
ncbi:SDR family oxidoreductase [Micromonospora sediminimaris]|uniref:SDR family oxidoreductase n=1 Tax=Micromonospora sediminimaris TaxID=547162 RepID=UPI0037AFC326